jgi:hypothetical protein
VLAVLAVSAGLTAAGSAASAAASQGSVPAVVSAYASDPAGLLARLKDLFGPGTGGTGIPFDNTAKVGQINRAHGFTTSFASGAASVNPIRLTNEWTAPVTVADSPVGLATIWINPKTNDPELADFLADPGAARALSEVPAAAYLIHDAPRKAWLALQTDVLTALVPGSTGLTGPTTAADYRTRVLSLDAANPPSAALPTGQGAINSIVIVSVALLVAAAILLAPVLRRKRRTQSASQAPDAAAPHTSAPPKSGPPTSAPTEPTSRDDA